MAGWSDSKVLPDAKKFNDIINKNICYALPAGYNSICPYYGKCFMHSDCIALKVGLSDFSDDFSKIRILFNTLLHFKSPEEWTMFAPFVSEHFRYVLHRFANYIGTCFRRHFFWLVLMESPKVLWPFLN